MVLEELDHPHVVRVIELLESPKEYYVVMELIPDGNLLDFINGLTRKNIPFLEKDAANLTNQIIMALSYMHGKQIIHRDLKLENLMIQKVKLPGTKEIEVVVKITDFGFACQLDPTKAEKLSLGSPMYTAPEVIKQISYDSRCDVWSLGVMTFMMLTGRAPFMGSSKSEIYKRSVNSEPDYAHL